MVRTEEGPKTVMQIPVIAMLAPMDQSAPRAVARLQKKPAVTGIKTQPDNYA